MTLTEYLRNPRVITNRELNALESELEEIESSPTDDEMWLEWADSRLAEISRILEISHRMARMSELGLRIIQGGAV